MTPRFRLTADGEDATGPVADRLIALRVTDAAGLEADQLEIELDDRAGRIAPPRRGAELRLSLGTEGSGLVDMGAWRVTALRGQGPDRRLTILGRAAALDGPIAWPRTRSWPDATLGAVARAVAGERGLKARVAAEFDAPPLGTVEQAEESDLNLLTRLADDAGAMATVKGGALIVTRAGAMTTADGRPLPETAPRPDEATAWRWSVEDREAYGGVVAFWSDRRGAEKRRVEIGEGEPWFELRRVYATEAEARRAALARLERFRRGAGSLTLDLAGPALAASADAPLRLTGFGAGADGLWRCLRVEHRLDGGGLRTSIEAERPNSGGMDA